MKLQKPNTGNNREGNNTMVRPVISNYEQLNVYQPRVAVIEDSVSPASKKVLELIREAGGKAMVIPRFLSDRLLASQGLTKQEISRIKNARSAEEVREFEQQITMATRLHLQYIPYMHLRVKWSPFG